MGRLTVWGFAFPEGKSNLLGEVSSEWTALVKRNAVRVLDLLLVR